MGSPSRPACGGVLRQDWSAKAGVPLALGLYQSLVCDLTSSCGVTLYFLIAALKFVGNLLELLAALDKMRNDRLVLFLLALDEPYEVLHQLLLLVHEGRFE